MASVLYQSIEALSRDKGIDPQIVVSAVEDAIALATRKYYKTQENMRAELDRESGEIRAYVYKTVVEAPEQLEDPVNQITLDDARALAPEVETGGATPCVTRRDRTWTSGAWGMGGASSWPALPAKRPDRSRAVRPALRTCRLVGHFQWA